MSIVYRWETPDQVGPYIYCDLDTHGRWSEVRHNEEEGRPNPYEDGIAEADAGEYAFADMRQEKAWFRPHERWIMLASGLSLVTLEAPIMRRGKCQVQIDRIGAHEVGVKCPFRLTRKRLADMMASQLKEAGV